MSQFGPRVWAGRGGATVFGGFSPYISIISVLLDFFRFPVFVRKDDSDWWPFSCVELPFVSSILAKLRHDLLEGFNRLDSAKSVPNEVS